MGVDQIQFIEEYNTASDRSQIPLYYDPDYLSLCEGKIICYCAIGREHKKPILVNCFQIISDQAYSLKSAPFGGIHATKAVDDTVVAKFLEYVIDRLKAISVSKITIRCAPAFYQSAKTDDKLFKNFGFDTSLLEINHHIPTDFQTIANDFGTMQKRRLNKCINAGFEVRQESLSALPHIYNFIVACRIEKQHSLPISLDKLKKSFEKLPDGYQLFGCYHQDQLTAATVCVSATNRVLYNYLPASKKSYNTFSPMVFLINELIKYCEVNEYNYLDLGTSMLDGRPNDNLIAFKSSVGGISSKRMVYTLEV